MSLPRNRRKRKLNFYKPETIKNMKRLILILQEKGGAGKSVFTYNLANIFHRLQAPAYYFDFDNGAKSSMSQLTFVNVKPFNLINNATKNIDRSKLNSFLDGISEEEKAEIVVCDFGAASSEQFLKYVESKEGRAVLASFKDEIQIEFHCVISGGNDYPSCGDYCESLFLAGLGVAKLFVAKNNNNQRPYNLVQENDISRLLEKYSAELIPFNITMENGDSDVTKIKAQMFNGLSSHDIKARSTRLVYNLMLDEMIFPLRN